MSIRFRSVRRDQPRQTDDVAPAIAAPVPFFDAARRSFAASAEDQWRNSTGGWREAEWTGDMWRRHREVERLTGQRLRPSAELNGLEVGSEGDGLLNDVSRVVSNALDAPYRLLLGDPSIDEYEARIDALRAQYPALSAVPSREALWKTKDAELRQVRQKAQAAGELGAGGMIGGFAGGTVAAFGDPVNVVATVATGGAGAGRPLLTRMAMQGAANAGVELTQAPGRAIDAERFGGPDYTAREAAMDVTFAATAGAGFEVVGELGKAGVRQLRSRLATGAADPETRGLGNALDRLMDDEAAIGPADDFDAAREALATGGPLPRVQPEQDLDDLFSEQPGGPATAARAPAETGFTVEYGTTVDADGVEAPVFYVRPTPELAAAEGLGPDDMIFGWVEPDRLRIERSNLTEGVRGRGLGRRMYEQAVREAEARGVMLVSDREVSPSAQRVWRQLTQTRGARRNAAVAFGADADAVLRTSDGGPVYTFDPNAAQKPTVREMLSNQSGDPVLPSVAVSQRGSAVPATKPPTSALESVDYRGRTIYAGRFDPMTVEADAARFQYKAEGDADGVTNRLKGVERWDATASDKVIVFEDADGRQIIADGHQRRGLARRLAAQGWEDAQLDGYLFRARDGWTDREVRVVAALKNIRGGSGTIMDAAKLFREAPGAMRDRSLPITGDFIHQARQLASLSDEGFRAVVNKVIPERYAAVIGEQAGDRPDLHGDLVELVRRGEPKSAEGARALVQEGLLDDFIKSEGRQMDLFGGLPRESTVIARGRIREAVMGALRRDEKLNAALVRNAEAIEAGGNILARSDNERRLAVDRAASELVSRLALRSGEMGEAFAEAAAAVTKGETTPGAAAKGLTARIRKAVAAGEDLDAVRAEVIDPAPPSSQALETAGLFDEPAGVGQRAQIAPKPEDTEIEAVPSQLDAEFGMAPDGSGQMTWSLEAKGIGEPDPEFGVGYSGVSGIVGPDGGWEILAASLPKAMRGKGLAVELYADVARRAADAGVRLRSDGRRGTSPDAARVWDGLERKGFEIKRHPDAYQEADGQWLTPDRSPVFEVESLPGERAPGLFDDLDEPPRAQQAADVLRRCAPGGS